MAGLQPYTTKFRVKQWWKDQWRTMVLPSCLLLGVAIGLITFFSLRNHKIDQNREKLNFGCSQRVNVLQEQFWGLHNFSDSFIALRVSVPAMQSNIPCHGCQQNTWSVFYNSTLGSHSFVSREVWFEHITNDERPQYEAFLGTTLHQYGNDMEMVPANPLVLRDSAPEYLTMTMGAGFDVVYGLDLLSVPTKGKPALAARDVGMPFYTKPRNAAGDQRIFSAFAPGYNPTLLPAVLARDPNTSVAQRQAAFVGILSTVFNISELIKAGVNQRFDEPNFIFRVFDVTPGINASDSPLFHPMDDNLGDYSGDYGCASTVNLGGGRAYEARCKWSPEPDTYQEPLLWAALAFVILALLGLLLYGMMLHKDYMKRARRSLKNMEDTKLQAEGRAFEKTVEAAAKTEFIANMGTEAKLPIEQLNMMTRALMQTPLDGAQLSYVQALRASADMLSSYLVDAHDFAAIEEGVVVLDHVPFDLRAVMDEVMAVFAGRVHDAGIELASLVEDSVPTDTLVGDPLRIRQVLMNLIGHSTRTTTEGHVRVRVRATTGADSPKQQQRGMFSQYSAVSTGEDSPDKHHSINMAGSHFQNFSGSTDGSSIMEQPQKKGAYAPWNTPTDSGSQQQPLVILEVEVEDTGPGLAPDAQRKLMEMPTGMQSMNPRLYGSSMGLSICGRLVQLWGGAFTVSSKMGAGSVFRFTVPLERAVASTGEEGSTPVFRPSFELPELKGARALVVADEDFSKDASVAHLKRLGMRVDTASEEKSAMARALAALGSDGRCQYRVVLVDLRRSPDELRRFANVLHSVPQLVQLSLILVTSARGEVLELLTALPEYAAVVQKPMRLATVAACISQVLHLEGSTRSSPRTPMDMNFGSPRSGPMSLRTLLSGRKVVVVDDSPTNRRSATRMLESLGAKVEYTAGASVQEDGEGPDGTYKRTQQLRGKISNTRSSDGFDILFLDEMSGSPPPSYVGRRTP